MRCEKKKRTEIDNKPANSDSANTIALNTYICRLERERFALDSSKTVLYHF